MIKILPIELIECCTAVICQSVFHGSDVYCHADTYESYRFLESFKFPTIFLLTRTKNSEFLNHHSNCLWFLPTFEKCYATIVSAELFVQYLNVPTSHNSLGGIIVLIPF